MKKLILLFFSALISSSMAFGQSYAVSSPGGDLTIGARFTDQVYISVSQNGKLVMWDSPFSMDLADGRSLGKGGNILRMKDRTVNETLEPAWGLRKEISDHFNEVEIFFEGNYSLVIRAYDDGVAWRYNADMSGVLTVQQENFTMRFREDHGLIAQVYDNFQTSYEKPYTRYPISKVKEDDFLALPLLIDQGGRKLLFTEADVYDYPGMYLKRQTNHNRHELVATLPAAAAATAPGGWCQFNMKVTEREPFLAKVIGKRSFPWRCMIVASEDADLADSDLVYKLASPSEIETDWITPGKVAWDWWNAWNLNGVDFETGVNNKTYEYYIDFAANNGLEYIIMDEGWSDPFDLFLPTPEIDVRQVIDYAESKGVRVILWCVWHTLDRQMEEALNAFAEWGVAGIKVDFIDRDDQDAINFYERLAREAAKRKLLVDYHGCSKPTGLSRTYPNVINYEGVMGNEYNKFSTQTSPGHDVDIVFTRMAAGPIDYTPGAMRNSTEGNFHMDNENTMSPGTRCHQLGMYVVYYSPLQMLCDAPTAYEAEPEVLSMIADVPTTWDDTKVLAAEMGEYVIIARKKGDIWYIGGINNWTERKVEISLDFLGEEIYGSTMFLDGTNANRVATDYQILKDAVTRRTTMTITLKKGGGVLGKMEKN